MVQAQRTPADELALYGLQWDQTHFLTYAELGGTRIVELFLLGGMDPDATDEMDRTALMRAATNGHIETVETLLAAGANPRLKDQFTRSDRPIPGQRTRSRRDCQTA